MINKCIACGKGMRLFGQMSSAKIFKCTSCGLGKTESRLQLTDQYHRDWIYWEREKQFGNIFQKRVGIIEKFAKKGKALEIGSSTGILLSLLKRDGWDVEGVEPSPQAAAVSEKRKVSTIVSTFEKAKLGRGKYDVVIFNHTLEHMVNPAAVLKKARTVLKPDGVLFLDVPNFASLSARFSGSSWKYILPEEHFWHFTPSSLFNLLNRAGFTVVYWEAHSGIWGYAHPWREVWESFAGGKKRFFLNVLTFLPTWILTKLKAGTGLTVVAQKT